MKEGLPGNQVVNRQFNNIVNDYNSMLVHCSDHGTQDGHRRQVIIEFHANNSLYTRSPDPFSLEIKGAGPQD